jgi:hypothetical protein
MSQSRIRQTAVLNFIEENFDTNAIVMELFPAFPHGVRVIDAEGGEMVVFWDLLRSRVDYRYPDNDKEA